MTSSLLPDDLESYTVKELELIDATYQQIKMARQGRSYLSMARSKQLPPDDPRHHQVWIHPKTGAAYQCQDPKCLRGETDTDWQYWLWCGGRGVGKTWTGSNWILSQALATPKTTWGVCGPTYHDAKRVCFDNPKSGIVALAQNGDIADYNKNNMRITLRNGSVIQLFSAQKESSIRGESLDGVWFDELCSVDGAGELFYYDALMPALREGNARMLITTTPAGTKILRQLFEDAKDPNLGVHVTSATIYENPKLSERRVKALENQYKGTRLYKQELLGEMLDDIPGALFTFDMINAARVERKDVPESRAKIVVALDPANTSRERSDDSGIVVACDCGDGHAYVLADRTLKGTPDQVVRAAVAAYHEYGCDAFVVEKNGVGDWIDASVAAVDPYIRVTKVYAMKGKYIRARPVSQLYEQGRVHHVFDRGGDGSRSNPLEKLESELCAVVEDGDRSAISDNRADALVWAITELRGLSQVSWTQAYGMKTCEDCEHVFPERMPQCPQCRKESPVPEKNIITEKTTELTGWAAAYTKRCESCGINYNRSLKGCPKCQPLPAAYMTQVLQFSGQQPGFKTSKLSKSWKRGI